MWGSGQGYGGMMGFGGFFGLLFWLLLIIIAVVLVKWLFGNTNNQPQGPSALEILNQRFATGEITEEEYLRMKKRIEGHE